MANIQQEASKIVEQMQKEIEEKTNMAKTISEGPRNEIDKLIAVQKKLSEIKNGNYSEEEISYFNSPYYKNYETVLKQMDSKLELVMNQFLSQYQYNIQFYQDPTRLLASRFFIQGIGYPIPKRYMEELKEAIDIKMNEYVSNYTSLFEEKKIDVTITPREYIGNDNLIKKANSYEVMISLKQKTKTK